MGDPMDLEEKARNEKRKRTLADLMAESNEEKDDLDNINGGAPSTSAAPIRGFRNSRGKILRIVRNPKNKSDPSAFSEGGATAVIENSAPLDLNSLLGGDSEASDEPGTSENGPGMLSGATLASMLSSLTEEMSKTAEGLTDDGEEDCDSVACRAAHAELVNCASDLARIEAKVEMMVSMIEARIQPSSSSDPSTSLASFSRRVHMAPRRIMRLASSLKDPLGPPPSTSAAFSVPLSLPIVSKTGRVPASTQSSYTPLRANDPSVMVSKLFSQPKIVQKPVPHETLADLKKKLARALLLFPGTEFTYGEFCEKTPGVMKGLSNINIREVFNQLTSHALLYRDDDELIEGTMKRNTVWQKELSKGKLRNLKKYDIPLSEYMESLDDDDEEDDD